MFKEISDYINSKEGEMLELLEILVNTDSGSRDKTNVDALGNKLKKCWMEIGFVVEDFIYNDVGNCLIARYNIDKSDKKVVLMGHFDTVFSKGETVHRPFKIAGSRAYGPGVGDMKGGLVSMFYAVKALKSVGCLIGPISIVLNSHEEIGSIFSRNIIIDESKNAGIVINVEPARANGAVVTGRKGYALLNVFAKGKAAHSGSEPQKGANAILEIAHRIIELQSFNNFREALTINVTMVSGGHTNNVIADKATAVFDIRFVKLDDLNNLHNCIIQLFDKTKIAGTECSLDQKIMFFPMERKENVLSAYKLVCKSAKEIGINIDEAFSGGSSDAGFTSQNGIPTICGMGPIVGNPHSVSEYMEIPSMAMRCKLLATTIVNFWKTGLD